MQSTNKLRAIGADISLMSLHGVAISGSDEIEPTFSGLSVTQKTVLSASPRDLYFLVLRVGSFSPLPAKMPRLGS
jgi:hypothetical protein